MSRGSRAVPVLLLVAALAACVVVTGCPPPSVQTSAGKTAYTADQVVLRIGELQTAAIDANASIDPKTGQPLLSSATTRRVVQFSVDAVKTLRASPDGWQGTVGPAYAGMKNQLAPEERTRLGLYLGVLDAILGAFTGGAP